MNVSLPVGTTDRDGVAMPFTELSRLGPDDVVEGKGNIPSSESKLESSVAASPVNLLPRTGATDRDGVLNPLTEFPLSEGRPDDTFGEKEKTLSCGTLFDQSLVALLDGITD